MLSPATDARKRRLIPVAGSAAARLTPPPTTSLEPIRSPVQERLQPAATDLALRRGIREIGARDPAPSEDFRPTPHVDSRTHVPPDDRQSPEQALAEGAGARGHGFGPGVRHAGRGKRACRYCVAGTRPHVRAPASSTTSRSSQPPASPRDGRATAPGLYHAGPSPGWHGLIPAPAG